jgi:hypothetical protein
MGNFSPRYYCNKLQLEVVSLPKIVFSIGSGTLTLRPLPEKRNGIGTVLEITSMHSLVVSFQHRLGTGLTPLIQSINRFYGTTSDKATPPATLILYR